MISDLKTASISITSIVFHDKLVQQLEDLETFKCPNLEGYMRRWGYLDRHSTITSDKYTKQRLSRAEKRAIRTRMSISSKIFQISRVDRVSQTKFIEENAQQSWRFAKQMNGILAISREFCQLGVGYVTSFA